MAAAEKERIATLEQVVKDQSEKITTMGTNIDEMAEDLKDILEIVNEFRGGQKLLKWVVTCTIAIGGVVAAFLNLFRSH